MLYIASPKPLFATCKEPVVEHAQVNFQCTSQYAVVLPGGKVLDPFGARQGKKVSPTDGQKVAKIEIMRIMS